MRKKKKTKKQPVNGGTIGLHNESFVMLNLCLHVMVFPLVEKFFRWLQRFWDSPEVL